MVVLRMILFLLPGFLGSRLLVALAGKKFEYRYRDEEKDWLERVEQFSYGMGKYAWRAGQGPVVVLVHGYGGVAAQWYKIADMLVKAGYCVVAPDITAHGSTRGDKIRFRSFIDDLKQLEGVLNEDIYAYVGHSAGGLCMMAGRRVHGLKARKYVCIATPSYPYPPIKVMRKKIQPPEKVIGGYQDFLGRQFGCEWDDIVAHCFDFETGNNLLLVYDENDKYLEPGDLENIRQYWLEVKVLITTDAGHEQLLRSDVCIEKVGAFLQGGIAGGSQMSSPGEGR